MRQRWMSAWLLAALFPWFAPQARAQPCSGVVYLDRGSEGLGVEDQPLAGAKVSDGVRVATSDAQGRYRLDAAPGRAVFLVKPPGTFVADFASLWRAPEAGCGDFVAGIPEEDLVWTSGWDVLVLADPQVKSPADVGYFRRDIRTTLAADYANGFAIFPRRGRVLEGGPVALGIVLGDIADDAPALYPAIADSMPGGTPMLYVPGNHDVDVGAMRDDDSLRAYARQFGPDTYAWEDTGATYVMLDDVIVRPAPGTAYVGGFREDQFAFLEAYLPTVPKDRLLVVGVHIPLFEAPGRDTFRDADRARLFALLDGFDRVLLLSGHTHTQRHHFHDAASGWHGTRPLHEYNVGAASGAFWSGAVDEAGVPDATMADGTPNGHALLRMDRALGYRLSWHPARVAADDPLVNTAMALHAPQVLRQHSWPGQAVHANVWMGMDDTRVEYRIDGGDWRPMQRVEAPDPRVVRQNVLDDAAPSLPAYDRAPQAVASTHLWRGALPTDLPLGEHRIEVRALDRWHGWRQARTSYRLASWPDRQRVAEPGAPPAASTE